MLGRSLRPRTDRWLAASAALSLLAGVQAGAAPDETGTGEARTSISTQHERGGRDAPSPGKVSEHRYDALVVDGQRASPSRGNAKSAAGGAQKVARQDFWFFDADVLLFNDDDGDGYFHGIDVLFDADTYYDFADVYAVLYLSYEGGPWNEFAATDTFRIFGATSDDEYVVVTELMSGYPRGSYDLLIELYDAFDGAFVAELGPADHPDFSFLPLEDFNRDDPDRHRHRHGGGAFDPWTSLLLAMCGVAAWLVRRRQRQLSITDCAGSSLSFVRTRNFRQAAIHSGIPFFGKSLTNDCAVLPANRRRTGARPERY